jgi:hypothetical protein
MDSFKVMHADIVKKVTGKDSIALTLTNVNSDTYPDYVMKTEIDGATRAEININLPIDDMRIFDILSKNFMRAISDARVITLTMVAKTAESKAGLSISRPYSIPVANITDTACYISTLSNANNAWIVLPADTGTLIDNGIESYLLFDYDPIAFPSCLELLQ